MKLQWDDPVPSEQKVYWEKWLVDFPDLGGFPGLVTKEQFAYSKNSSTIVALLKVVDEWKWANDQRLITTAGFLVLWKAFDVIDHSLLLQKLKANGFSAAEIFETKASRLPPKERLSNCWCK